MSTTLQSEQTTSGHDAATQADLPSFRWVICALLFLATTINYMDRQILGLLAPVLQKQIGWNELQYGHIVVAFQAAYAIGLVSFGWLIDRWGTKKGYSWAIVVWSAAAALHALARSVVGFGTARFLLGLGESGNFPAAIKTVAEWFPKPERALATGLFNCGSNVGAIIAPLIVPAIAIHFGWQAAFIAMGGCGFAWVILWLFLYQSPENSRWVSPKGLEYLQSDSARTSSEAASEAAVDARAEPPHVRIRWLELLRYQQAWAYCLQSIFVSPIWWFYLYWLPKFFSARYGLSISKSSPLLAIIYSLSLLGSIGGGLLPAVFLGRGWTLNWSRKSTLLCCVLLALPMTLVSDVGNVWAATALIGCAAAAMQAWSANTYTMVSDLFPKRAVASVVGLGSAFGSVAAIVLAEVVGSVLENTGSYRVPFIIAGLSLPIAWALIHGLAPRWEAADFADLSAI